ncbi:hypothetical protein AXF42_Ash013663 [Apostasia shenzhenica]|uniref:Uncharacterized protein n=1 Tax=Apostasia shenzhenica TaxID=1088818 RepID=A0A2I0APM8_9ASPA|nr:hypothetical protein AXF42_Ash013663 [Apostasia shenzhenica]
MGVWREGNGWCFCGGGGRSERVKGSIFSGKGPAMASISSGAGGIVGTGFLIHRGLLLTSHGTLPSVAAADAAEIQLNHGRLPARLVPYRAGSLLFSVKDRWKMGSAFFITSSVLDLTIVGLDTSDIDSNSQGHQPNYLKTSGTPGLNLGSAVYLLGFDKKELSVGEGKVVIATDNLIKILSERTWSPGSAGFDMQGNLAFMTCDPMKLASSPAGKSSSSSSSLSSSCTRDSPMLFGIPIPIIYDWLNQHWEGSLDELCKPKLPLIRLMSAGQKSENSCPSFSYRQIFKPLENDDPDFSLANVLCKSKHHEHGIRTPEVYESPRLTSEPVSKKENTQIHLLDINFPPRAPRSIALSLPVRQLPLEPSESISKLFKIENPPIGDDCCSEVNSSSSPPMYLSDPRNECEEFSSGEETMYSAETMESRNIPSPPRESKFLQVTRSHSCVNYSRWASPVSSSQRDSTARRAMLQKQYSVVGERESHSHVTAVPQKCHDYCSPTVSSSMKKKPNGGLDRPSVRPRQSAIQVLIWKKHYCKTPEKQEVPEIIARASAKRTLLKLLTNECTAKFVFVFQLSSIYRSKQLAIQIKKALERSGLR